jgi:hypothetical protein
MYIVFKVDNLLTDTAEIWTDAAEKASWDPANRTQKLGLVWEIRKKSAKMTTFTYCSPSYLFYGVYIYPPTSLLYLCSPVYIEQPNWAE